MDQLDQYDSSADLQKSNVICVLDCVEKTEFKIYSNS